MANLVGYPGPSAGDTTKVFTTADNPLGMRGFDAAGNEYIFLKGVASLVAGDWVTYNGVTGVTARIPTTTVSGMLAVAVAAPAAGQFGWFQIFGLTPTYTAITTGSTDGATLTVGTGTAGRVTGGGPVTTKNVFGATAVGVSASNIGTAFICYPFAFGSATI
jgi:hypothetical protein